MPDKPQRTPSAFNILGDRAPRTPLQSMATTGGPAFSQTGEPRLEHPGMEPSPGKIIGQTVAGTAGALLAPEALAVAGGLRFAPQLLQTGLQFAMRAAGAGVGIAAEGELTAPKGETPEQKSERRAADFVSGAGGEALGTGLTYGANRALRATSAGAKLLERLRLRRSQALEPGAAEVQRGLREFGGSLLPAQVTRSQLTDSAQNILESTFTSMNTMANARQNNVNAAMEWLNTAAPKIAEVSTPTQAGQLIEIMVRNPLAAQKAAVAAAYRTLDGEIQAAGLAPSIDLTPQLRGFENEFSMRLAKADPAAVKIRSYLDNPTPLTFDEADQIRGMLLDLARKDSASDVSPTLRRYASKVAQDVDQAIEQAAQNAGAVGDRIRTAMEAARGARRMQAEFFDEELIGPLLEKAAPEDVAATFFADNNPTQINALRRIVYEQRFRKAIGGDPNEYWNKIQSYWMWSKRKMEGGERHFHELDGEALGQAMDRSQETFEALYPDKKQREYVRRSVHALEMTQQKGGGSRSGTVIAQMGQGRYIGNAVQNLGNVVSLGGGGAAAGAGHPGAGALLLMAPWVFSKAWASKNFSSWLVARSLAKNVRSSSFLGSVVAQGANALVKDGLPFILYDPATDSATVHSPTQGTTGQFAPTGKPVSKIRPAP